jgi:hypothetical protein
MTDDLNGADASGLIDLDDAEIEEIAGREIAHDAYVVSVVMARCGDVRSDEDLAPFITQPEPLGELPLAVADQILDVVIELDARMGRLEASIQNSADIVASVWEAMQDYPLEAKQAMLRKLEILVESETATHHRLR